jgi:hypothetical protein
MDQGGSVMSDARFARTRIVLNDFAADDQRPELIVYGLNAAFEPLFSLAVENNELQIDENLLKEAAYIGLGPRFEDTKQIDREQLSVYRINRFRELLRQPELIIPKRDWYRWFWKWYCVSGKVRHCFPYPWVISDLLKPALSSNTQLTFARQNVALKDLALVQPSQQLASRVLSPLFRRCEDVCEGLVEVYQRVCCCKPWIIYDPRLNDVLRDLEAIIERIPEDIRWPPIPQPDPPPFLERSLFLKAGALDERALHAANDLDQIRHLHPIEQAAYIQARPYLWCSCGQPKKVAQGFIQPGGAFSICWRSWPLLLAPHCHYEYAYVVKQVLNGALVTIYDGVAANRWYDYADQPTLISYHPKTIGCGDLPETPVDGAVVLLDYIGITDSADLKTPIATGWDRVAAPSYNDGLVFPAANAAAARGTLLDRNWGGTLSLRFLFSEPVKAAGGVYYRVSVTAADSAGTPTGDRAPFADGLSWEKVVPISGGYDIVAEPLGPNIVGGEANLYRIPYHADVAPGSWRGIQYHAQIDTAKFANQRYLVTLEVFDASGQRIRPVGASGPGIDAGFSFGRVRYNGMPAPNNKDVDLVPFAALTHMFWWDNRPAVAEIVDLRVNSAESTAECQFLSGPGSATFSVGYRAYHPVEAFQRYHSINWRRGLSGASGSLETNNPNNVGQPPAALGVSGTASFNTMLGTHTKCAFSVNLSVATKTYNGFGSIFGPFTDQASFAVEKT